jgi:hypothetical protein
MAIYPMLAQPVLSRISTSNAAPDSLDTYWQ